MRTFSAVLIVTTLVSTLVGCDDGDKKESPLGSLIKAKEGGMVKASGSEDLIVIPANALSNDTEITLSVGQLANYPKLENGREKVTLIEPAGVVLAAKATIIIDLGQPAITASQIASVVQLIDDEWQPLELDPGIDVREGTIAALTSLFAPTAVVVKDVASDSGSILGSVKHIYTGDPLPGIRFELWNDGVAALATTESDAKGTFRFADIPVGWYSVIAIIADADNCFHDPTVKEAVVAKDQTTDVAFAFVPGPCGN